MEAAFALLLPLVAGYLYVSGYKKLKYKCAREDGHRLYFRVALHGLWCFVAAALLFSLLNAQLKQFVWFTDWQLVAVDTIRPLLKEPDKAAAQLAFVIVCIGSVGVGGIVAVISNVLLKGQPHEALLDAVQENDLERLLLTAAVQVKSISITMTSGKVYVGIVTCPLPAVPIDRK